jgi:hypothetical protein
MALFIYHYKTASGVISADTEAQARLEAARRLGILADDRHLSVTEDKPRKIEVLRISPEFQTMMDSLLPEKE